MGWHEGAQYQMEPVLRVTGEVLQGLSGASRVTTWGPWPPSCENNAPGDLQCWSQRFSKCPSGRAPRMASPSADNTEDSSLRASFWFLLPDYCVPKDTPGSPQLYLLMAFPITLSPC